MPIQIEAAAGEVGHTYASTLCYYAWPGAITVRVDWQFMCFYVSKSGSRCRWQCYIFRARTSRLRTHGGIGYMLALFMHTHTHTHTRTSNRLFGHLIGQQWPAGRAPVELFRSVAPISLFLFGGARNRYNRETTCGVSSAPGAPLEASHLQFEYLLTQSVSGHEKTHTHTHIVTSRRYQWFQSDPSEREFVNT